MVNLKLMRSRVIHAILASRPDQDGATSLTHAAISLPGTDGSRAS